MVEEIIPEDLLHRYKFLSRSEAFNRVHFPTSEDYTAEDLAKFKTPAQKRLIFEELFLIRALAVT